MIYDSILDGNLDSGSELQHLFKLQQYLSIARIVFFCKEVLSLTQINYLRIYCPQQIHA
jgi:hypothetical protein